MAAQAASLEAAGVSIEYFPIVGKGIRNYLKAAVQLRTLLERDPAIALIHAHFGYCGIVGALAKKGRKLIVSFMGDDLHGSLNQAGRYTNRSRFFVRLNRFLVKQACDAAIVKSKNMKAGLPKSARIEVIPNGIDLNRFTPVDKHVSRTKLQLADGNKIILFLSDPDRPEKNFPLLRDAVIRLSDIAGLQLLIQFNVDQSELKYYYGAADVVALPSYHEGSPNVIKEAMACNRPIVSTDVGDVREHIEGVAGCYIAQSEPEDFAARLREALAFGGPTDGRKKMLDLGMDSTAKRLVDVYKTVLENY